MIALSHFPFHAIHISYAAHQKEVPFHILQKCYLLKLRTSKATVRSHITYYVKEYYVFCSHNIAISASREL